jgi:hypothetical protein
MKTRKDKVQMICCGYGFASLLLPEDKIENPKYKFYWQAGNKQFEGKWQKLLFP